MMIKILGTGCPNCLKLEANAKQACEELGIQADFVKVTQLEDITAYNIMRTPGLVFDEKVVSFGRVLMVEDIKALLTKHA